MPPDTLECLVHLQCKIVFNIVILIHEDNGAVTKRILLIKYAFRVILKYLRDFHKFKHQNVILFQYIYPSFVKTKVIYLIICSLDSMIVNQLYFKV